jgi:uncharacterized protein YaiE (UPF0345 family)
LGRWFESSRRSQILKGRIYAAFFLPAIYHRGFIMFKINEYFDGSVASIAFQTETLPATVGVMAKGDYEFGTSQREYMTVVSGSLTAILPGETEAKTYEAGETFIVEANQRFKVSANVESAYLCRYE